VYSGLHERHREREREREREIEREREEEEEEEEEKRRRRRRFVGWCVGSFGGSRVGAGVESAWFF
jgi:hypothetical protein